MKKMLVMGALIFLAACSKKDSNGVPPDPDPDQDEIVVIKSSKNKPGLGTSTEIPYTRPLTIAPGVKIVRRGTYLFNPALSLLHGNMNTFYVDVNIVNETNAAVKVDFPMGTVFLPIQINRNLQRGMTTTDISINVPPTGPNKDTTTVYFGLACLNKSFGLPYGFDPDANAREYPIARDMYELEGITTDSNLQDFCILLIDYPKLKLTKHYDPSVLDGPAANIPEWLRIYLHLQDMVWEITDNDGIDEAEMKTLKTALNPYKK